MFGVSRKKSKPTRIRSSTASSSDDNDDDDDAHRRAQQHNQRSKKKGGKRRSDMKKNSNKAKTKSPMLSFDPEDGGNDNENEDKTKKRRKKKHSSKSKSKQERKNKNGGGGGGSLGYGGGLAGSMPMNASDGSSSDEGEQQNNKMDVVGGEDSRGTSYYNTAALEKLKREQKRSTLVKDDGGVKSEPVAKSAPTDRISGIVAANDTEEEEHVEEDFISLSGVGRAKRRSKTFNVVDPVVLTGDDAMAFADREDEDVNNAEFDHGLQSPPTPPPLMVSGVDNNEKSMTGKVAGIDINADIMNVDNEPSTEEVEEGNRRWEDMAARRAGVLPPNAAKYGGQEQNRSTRQQQQQQQQRGATTSSSSLSQIRTSLQPTISNLHNIHSDLETSLSRHQSKLSSASDDLTKQTQTLEKHGKALEYYQGLREDLATWMGALRELNGMVDKVEGAKRRLEAEMTWRRMERLWEWGNDCTEVLERQGLLKTKVMGDYHDGRDEANRVQTAVEVDEFGRDLSSMETISRIKRWNERRKRCLERLQDAPPDNVDLADTFQQDGDNFDRAEIVEWEQRHEALVQAIAIVPNLVKDDYLSISNLCSVFLQWERLYPEDYANCYADMSLVQMASVLVRLELCGQWDVLGLHAQSSSTSCLEVSECKWFRELKKGESQKKQNAKVDTTVNKTNPTKNILQEVVQKQIVGRVLDSFSFEDDHNKSGNERHSIYDPFSVNQTKCMCSTVKSLLGYLSNCAEENGKQICEKSAEKILNALMTSVKYCIGKMAVPVVDVSKITLERNEFVSKDGSKSLDGETADAVVYAVITQAKELCTLVENMLGYWYPLINRELHNQQDMVASLVRFVFADIISLRLLPILHSLHDTTSCDEKYSEMPKTFITGMLDAMQDAGLLDTDEWMLMAAPLRVAAKQWEDNNIS